MIVLKRHSKAAGRRIQGVGEALQGVSSGHSGPVFHVILQEGICRHRGRSSSMLVPPISVDGEDTAQVDRIWSWVSSVFLFCSLYLLTCKTSTDVCRSALVEHELVTLVCIHRWHFAGIACLPVLSFLPPDPQFHDCAISARSRKRNYEALGRRT